MKDILAVDTQVVMIACRMASDDPEECHRELIDAFHGKARLALDKHTRQEYEENMGEESAGRKWLTNLALKDRIHVFATVPKEKRPTSTELQRIRFSKADTRFLRLALATTSRRLVAEERHFVNVKATVKKMEQIIICDSSEACAYISEIQASPAGSPMEETS